MLGVLPKETGAKLFYLQRLSSLSVSGKEN